MAPFPFILSLYSVTSGLGLTLLVSSVAKMIEARDRTRRYWVHTCWLAFLFVVNVTSWLSLWVVRDHQTWSILEALLLLLVPILLYTVSYLAVPNFDDAANLDLRIHYFRQAGWMQGLLLLALLSGSMAVRAIEGRWNITLADVLRFAAMVTLLPGIVSRRPAIHATQMIVLILILVVALLRVAEPIA
jgi:hypothetical protein